MGNTLLASRLFLTRHGALHHPMTTVLAYLDPGSGSMILQILAGGVAAVAVTAKLYWNRILRFLHIRKDDPEAAETPAAKSTDSA